MANDPNPQKPKHKKIGSSVTTPTHNKKRKEVKIRVPKTENIIFIGSEMYYDSFWLKMMFISAAYAKVDSLRPANKKTIAYVDNGYTYAEKLTLDYLRDKKGFEIIRLASSSDIVALMNRDREEYKLQDVAFFSHGEPNLIALNYWKGDNINFKERNLLGVNKKAFTINGCIYSYACRTGVSVEDYKKGFKNEADAKPENSLAQKMSDHFGIEVHAFLRRTFYGDILREKSHSETIGSIVRTFRKGREGQVINVPPDHEALPHPGLENGLLDIKAAEAGTNEYALWRIYGGLKLPVAAESPTGLPTEMRVFRPSHE